MVKFQFIKEVNRSHVVDRNITKNPESYGKKICSGPIKRLSERDKRIIINCSINTMNSLKQIIIECQVKVSKSTISRFFKNSNSIVSQKLLSVPRLLLRHKSACLEFVK